MRKRNGTKQKKQFTSQLTPFLYLLIPLSFVLVLLCSCYTTVTVRGDIEPYGDLTPTGKRKGPGNIQSRIILDSKTLDLQVTTSGEYHPILSQGYRANIRTCKQERQKSYSNLYLVGGVQAGLGAALMTTALILGADEVPAVTGLGGGFLGIGLIMLIPTAVADSRHPDNEPFDCRDATSEEEADYEPSSEEIETEHRTSKGPPEREAILDYRVRLKLAGETTVLSPNKQGVVKANLRQIYDNCPKILMWNDERDEITLPEVDRFIKTIALRTQVEYDEEIVASGNYNVPVLYLDQYLRDRAEQMVPPAQPREEGIRIIFTLQDINTRLPIQNAKISISAEGEKLQPHIVMPREVQLLSQQLKAIPCPDISDRFLEIATTVLEAREEQSRPLCVSAANKVTRRTNELGQFEIEFCRHSRIHIEARHEDYYYAEVNFGVGDDRIRVMSTSKRIEAAPARNNPGNWEIRLLDVGRRIRQGNR